MSACAHPHTDFCLIARSESHLVPAVLLQTVEQAAGVGQPEGRHLKVIVVFLQVNDNVFNDRRHV